MKQNHYFKLFLIAVSMLFPVVASAQFGGGNGSEQDPYLIEDIDHWLELSDNVLSGETYDGVYFQMLSDIDFSILNMVQIQFIPVGGWGNENNSFAGYFDGGGYSVSGLDLAYDNFVGLFGKTTGGYIQNLNVQSGYFMGDTYIGALIGYNAGAEVYNCHVGTEVYVYGLSGNMSHMGGLIGYNAGTEVSDCSSQATIVGNTNIGGLIGYNAGETIRDCSSEGTVIGTIYVGGLIGYNIGNEVVDCYSEATVTSANSEAQIGGLIGYNEGAVSGSSSKANVSCSFRSTSSLSGTALIGGLIGHNNQAEITNCFSEAIVWSYASGNRMGGLIGQNNLASVSSSYSNAEVNATVTTLGNFIIGGLIAENSGVISDCYSIANVTVSGPTPFVAGLIGYNKGTISNCYVSKNASVTANQNSAGKVGGLTADNEVLITDSYSSATVTVRGASSSASVGGLTSYNLGTGVIRNSYVTAVAVISSEGSSATVSGLAGYTSVGSLIENCYSEATVRGQSTTNNYSCVVSGLIGIHSGEVRNSYSTGVVEGVGNYVVVGGLIGDERSGITNNCYSTATLIGTGSEVRMGGLAGFFRGSAGAVSNCYIAPKLQAGNSASRYIGIFTGMNSTNITNCYFLTIPGRGAFGGTASSTELFVKTEEELRATAMVASPGSRGSSLNFNQSQNPLPWMVDFTPNMNDGYPILSWEIQPPTVSTDTAIALTLSTALLKGTVVAGANPVLNKGFIYKRASDAKWTRVEINEIELEKELTGLPADTPYQFRAFASTADKIFYGKQKTFILRTQPIVETDTVVDITQTTATIKGIIDPGLAPITQQGFEFKIGSDEGWTVFDIPGNTPEKALENLTAYTVYQYKTFATTSFGTVYGETKSFRTKPIPPTITTDSATVITQTSATLWSTVTLGSESITEQGFYYKESTAQEWTKSTISELSNLTAYTFYDYQAFVTTASDTAYGSIETFRTRPIPPTITTDSATVITQTSATLWSTVTLGSESITEQGFYYKESTAQEWTKSTVSELSNLTAYTFYDYQAFVTTVSDTAYGSIETFRTRPVPPTITTDSATVITQTSATLWSTVTLGSEAIAEQGFYYKESTAQEWTKTTISELSNLTAYTIYDYQAFVTTVSDTAYGSIETFRTRPVPPTITTDSATVITQTSATLWSTITLGSESITEQGFYYKESTAQEWTKTTISELSNLTAYTIYDYQAFVTTASDTAYGSIETFRTRPIPPTITTDSATVITQTSATLWSTVTLGSESITEQGFYYKKNTAEEWIKTINSELTGLIPLTRYEYKAFATTVSNTVYGSVQTFMTSGMPCVGFSNKYSAGPAGTEAATPDNFFTLGYSYSIKTIDEESISITFEFEDARITGNLTVFIGGVEKSPVLEKTNGKYTGAFSGYTWGQEVTISLRIARENGFSFTKPVFYIVGNDCLQPVDFVIEQTETRTKAEYWAGNYGNIIFKSVDFAIGELVIPSGETLEVNGVVKLQRTYTQERWSTIGFAFEVEDIYCESFENGRTLNVFYDENNGDFRLKKYNGIYNGFYYSFEPQGGGVYENYLIKDVGYIIQFPTTLVNKEITFASAPGITLKNIDERNIADGYSMICNYTLQNSPLTGADYYYIFEHDLKNDFELVAEGNVSNIRVKLFEAFIVAKNLTEPPRTISIYPPSDTESIFDDKGNIVEIRYYTIHGMEIKQPMPGYIYIEKRVYDTGTVEINKRIESK